MRTFMTCVSILLGFSFSSLAYSSTSKMAELNKLFFASTPEKTQLEISADKPLTFIFYKTASGTAVIDIAGATPNATFTVPAKLPEILDSVVVEKKVLSTITLTRLIITLKGDYPFTVQASPENKGRLLAIFTGSPEQASKPFAKTDSDLDESAPLSNNKEKVEVPLIVKEPETLTLKEVADIESPKAEPVATPAIAVPPPQIVPVLVVAKAEPKQVPIIEDTVIPEVQETLPLPVVPDKSEAPGGALLRVQGNTIKIFAGSTIRQHKIFKLSNPNRWVVDFSAVKNKAVSKSYTINNFGISKARIGIYPDKTRIVFDLEAQAFPKLSISTVPNGLVLKFTK